MGNRLEEGKTLRTPPQNRSPLQTWQSASAQCPLPPSPPPKHRSALQDAQTPLAGREPRADFPVRREPPAAPQRECPPQRTWPQRRLPPAPSARTSPHADTATASATKTTCPGHAEGATDLGSGAGAAAGAAGRAAGNYLRKPRARAPAPRALAGPPAADAAAARGGSSGGAAPQSGLQRSAPASRSGRPAPVHRWEPPRVGVGANPAPARASPPGAARSTLFLSPGRLPAPAPATPAAPCQRPGARPGRLRSLRIWGCWIRGPGARPPGGLRTVSRSLPAPAATRTPSSPARASPTPRLPPREENACPAHTLEWTDASPSPRRAKLLQGVHGSGGRSGHRVGAARLLFNHVASAGAAARVAGHVGTAEAGCCQYQGFLRILKL